MRTCEQVKLLETVFKAALLFMESLDEGQVEAYGDLEFKRLNKALNAAVDELGDPCIEKVE